MDIQHRTFISNAKEIVKMKHIITIGLGAFLVCCHSSRQKPAQKPTLFEYYKNDTIRELLKAVIRTDSINTTCYLTFKSFDQRDSLVTELNYYKCQNNSKAEYLIRNVYDRQGKLILREIFNMEGSEIEREVH